MLGKLCIVFMEDFEQQKVMCINYAICKMYYIKVYLEKLCWQIIMINLFAKNYEQKLGCKGHVEKLSW